MGDMLRFIGFVCVVMVIFWVADIVGTQEAKERGTLVVLEEALFGKDAPDTVVVTDTVLVDTLAQ